MCSVKYEGAERAIDGCQRFNIRAANLCDRCLDHHVRADRVRDETLLVRAVVQAIEVGGSRDFFPAPRDARAQRDGAHPHRAALVL